MRSGLFPTFAVFRDCLSDETAHAQDISHAGGSKLVTFAGLSLIFQGDGELKKVAGGQKKSGAAAELARGVGGYRGGLGFEKITFANIGVTEKS